MNDRSLPDSPYVGLVPYTEADSAFFFGREREISLIIANLLSSRLTVVYGESGVGKSSVLRAGVCHAVDLDRDRKLQAGGRPEALVVYFGAWRDEPVKGLIQALDEALTPYIKAALTVVPATRIDEALKSWSAATGCDLLVILDQFEEYFLYHDSDLGDDSFAAQLAAAVNRRDLNANFLISLRADAMAKLDRFSETIPSLFENYLRIEHMDREAAASAIRLPIEEYNSRLPAGTAPVEIEDALVQKILDDVGADSLGRALSGQGSEAAPVTTEGIETAYLQLVLTRLWSEGTAGGSRHIGLATLERLHGVMQIAQTHLDQALEKFPQKEKATAAAIFFYLVTPSGSKIAHRASDLAMYTRLPEARVSEALKDMSRGDVRIVRTVMPPMGEVQEPRYEIFHDVLALSTLAWRTRFLQQQTAQVRKRAIAGLVLVVGIAVFGLAVSNYRADHADDQKQNAVSTARSAVSVATKSADVAYQTGLSATQVSEANVLLLNDIAKRADVTPPAQPSPAPTTVVGSTPTRAAGTPAPVYSATPQGTAVSGANACNVPKDIDFVTVRSGPDTTYPSVSYLRGGDRFVVSGWSKPRNFQKDKDPSTKNNWLNVTVSASGTKGWITSDPVTYSQYQCSGFDAKNQSTWRFPEITQ